MLRLFRMYRLVKHINMKIGEENLDEFWNEVNDNKFVYMVRVNKCLDDYKIISSNKEYKRKKVFKSAEKNGYLKLDWEKILITDKGEDLIEGYGYGFIRELATKEWKFLLILAFVIGLIANPHSYEIRGYNRLMSKILFKV